MNLPPHTHTHTESLPTPPHDNLEAALPHTDQRLTPPPRTASSPQSPAIPPSPPQQPLVTPDRGPLPQDQPWPLRETGLSPCPAGPPSGKISASQDFTDPAEPSFQRCLWSGPAFFPSLGGPCLPRNVAPGCPGSSQGHWPGLSGGAEGPQGLEQDGRGRGRGEQEGAVGSPLICRKHLGKHVAQPWREEASASRPPSCLHCLPAPVLPSLSHPELPPHRVPHPSHCGSCKAGRAHRSPRFVVGLKEEAHNQLQSSPRPPCSPCKPTLDLESQAPMWPPILDLTEAPSASPATHWPR